MLKEVILVKWSSTGYINEALKEKFITKESD